MTAPILVPSAVAARGTEQEFADPHERRPLLRGNAVVLGRAHAELRETELAGELAEPPEVLTRLLRVARERRHGHEAPHVGVALDETCHFLGSDSGLRRLSGQVHLYES